MSGRMAAAVEGVVSSPGAGKGSWRRSVGMTGRRWSAGRGWRQLIGVRRVVEVDAVLVGMMVDDGSTRYVEMDGGFEGILTWKVIFISGIEH